MRKAPTIKGMFFIALGCGILFSTPNVQGAQQPAAIRHAVAKERAQNQALLRERMAPVLRELPARVEKQGKAGTLRAKDVTVSNGWVRIAVKLAKPSASVVTRLKQLGFNPAVEGGSATTLTGKAPVAKLKEIALTDGVRRVGLAPKAR